MEQWILQVDREKKHLCSKLWIKNIKFKTSIFKTYDKINVKHLKVQNSFFQKFYAQMVVNVNRKSLDHRSVQHLNKLQAALSKSKG